MSIVCCCMRLLIFRVWRQKQARLSSDSRAPRALELRESSESRAYTSVSTSSARVVRQMHAKVGNTMFKILLKIKYTKNLSGVSAYSLPSPSRCAPPAPYRSRRGTDETETAVPTGLCACLRTLSRHAGTFSVGVILLERLPMKYSSLY